MSSVGVFSAVTKIASGKMCVAKQQDMTSTCQTQCAKAAGYVCYADPCPEPSTSSDAASDWPLDEAETIALGILLLVVLVVIVVGGIKLQKRGRNRSNYGKIES